MRPESLRESSARIYAILKILRNSTVMILLDSSTNRSYGNAIFSGKRRIIIGKDKGISIALPKISKNGLLQVGEDTKAKSSFVPPCTKQVFMKYYSATMTDANYWTKKVDAVGYLNDIKACINKLEE